MKCPVCHREFYEARLGTFKFMTEYNQDWCAKCIRKDRLETMLDRARRYAELPYYLTDYMNTDQRTPLHKLSTRLKNLKYKRWRKKVLQP